MKYGTLGTISHGTLRTEDLLEAFSSELDWLVRANITELTPQDIYRFGKLVGEAQNVNLENGEDNPDEMVNELQDALNEFSPPYCYFGANKGDGSDFGFWPCMEQIEELPKVSDPNEVENHLGEDCAFVNDHGNVTVYGADGRVILELV